MALRITQTDPLAIGERWEDFDADVSIKIAGLDDEKYQIALERARRLIAKQDAAQTLSSIKATAADRREHDVQCELLGRYIVLDWKGDVTDASGKFLPYSPENAANLLRGNIALFAWVLATAAKVATDAQEEVAEAVGKSSSASGGSANGRAGETSSD